ncbi:MAG: NTP transferase domain-containing protein [Microgenomates group bacterium]
MSELTIIIPAAGRSLRMQGQDKLMMLVDGVACLRRIAACAAALNGRVIIALNHAFPDRADALSGLAVERLVIDRPQDGMSASLRQALDQVAKDASGVMIVPADMPELDVTDLRMMQAAFQENPNNILQGASQDGRPGHPVIFPQRLFADLMQIKGDRGARAVLDAHLDEVILVALPGQHAVVDLDTCAEWANWNNARCGSDHQ